MSRPFGHPDWGREADAATSWPPSGWSHSVGGGAPPANWEGWGHSLRLQGVTRMYSDSVLYTIGTALNRAHDNNVAVQILVEGQWLSGHVAAVDGHGVVLHSDDAEHAVIRMGSVSAVRVFAAAPSRTPIGGMNAVPMPSGYEQVG